MSLPGAFVFIFAYAAVSTGLIFFALPLEWVIPAHLVNVFLASPVLGLALCWMLKP